MKRKNYIRPTTETVEVDSPTILAGSLGSDDTPNVNFTDIPADDTGLTAD